MADFKLRWYHFVIAIAIIFVVVRMSGPNETTRKAEYINEPIVYDGVQNFFVLEPSSTVIAPSGGAELIIPVTVKNTNTNPYLTGSQWMYVQCSLLRLSENPFLSGVGSRNAFYNLLDTGNNCNPSEQNTRTAHVRMDFLADSTPIDFVITVPKEWNAVTDAYVYCAAYERCEASGQDPFVSDEFKKGPYTVSVNPSSCVDSDGGNIINTKGVTTFYCDGQEQVFTDNCNGEVIPKLLEGSCDIVDYTNCIMPVTAYTCPNGCVNGACTGSCDYPNIPCAGSCVDPRYNNNNCNGCGNVCTAPKTCQESICKDPVIPPVCTENYERCCATGTSCQTYSRTGDIYKCTSNAWASHETCGNLCKELTNTAAQCVNCIANSDCATGEVCISTTGLCCKPKTCAELGHTCSPAGGISDTCGGTISCDTCDPYYDCTSLSGAPYSCKPSSCYGKPDGDPCATGICKSGSCCTISCENKQCGDNGCGGSCGECTGATTCASNLCKKKDGEACSLASECASNLCTDNICGTKVCPIPGTIDFQSILLGGTITIDTIDESIECVPAGCKYVDLSDSAEYFSAGLIDTLTCCEDTHKDKIGTKTIKVLGISVGSLEYGKCVEGKDFCSYFNFLEDTVGEKYYCMVGIAGGMMLVMMMMRMMMGGG